MSSDLKDKIKRIVTPRQTEVVSKGVSKLTSNHDVAANNMLTDSLEVLNAEIFRYKNKVGQGKSLDLKEARIMQGYIKCLIDLSRESRERDKDEDLSKLTMDELIALAGQIKK